MTKVYTLSAVRHRPDPEKDHVDVPPHVVHEFPADVAKDLKRLGAARDPSENEAALYALANPAAEEAPESAPEPRAAKGGKPKAAAKPEDGLLG